MTTIKDEVLKMRKRIKLLEERVQALEDNPGVDELKEKFENSKNNPVQQPGYYKTFGETMSNPTV